MAVPYAGSEHLTVLPQDYLSVGTGGNTAQYESTGSYNMHGGSIPDTLIKGGFISQHQTKSKYGKPTKSKYRYNKSKRNKSNRKKKYTNRRIRHRR